MLKRLLLPLFILLSFCAAAQLPGATTINSRYDWLGGRFRALKLPMYADTTQYPVWLPRVGGDIMLDTAGEDKGTVWLKYESYWHPFTGSGGGSGGDTTSTYLAPLLGLVFTETADTLSLYATPYNNLAALRGVPGALNGQGTSTLGYYSPGDGGGASYYWDASSTLPDDSGAVIQPTGVTTGRWRQVFYDGTLWTQTFGVRGNGSNYSQQLIAAIRYAGAQGTVKKVGNPQGQVKVNRYALNFVNNVVSAQQNASIEFFGMGRANAPGQTSYSGTTFMYDDVGGAGTAIMTIKIGNWRFWKFRDFSLMCATNDAVESGIAFENSGSSSFHFENIAIGAYRAMPTYGVKLNVNEAANAEFNTWERCVFNGTLNAYYHDAPQALSTTFIKCQGSVERSGTLLNFVAAGGGQFFGCDFSAINATTSRRWAASSAYSLGWYVIASGNIYRVATAGTSASVAPTGTGSAITDGTVVWSYVRADEGQATYLAIGGGQVDPITFIGGRSEGPSTLVNVLNTSSYLTVNFLGGTFSMTPITTATLATGTPDVIRLNSAVTASIFMSGITTYQANHFETVTDGIYLPWRINVGASRACRIIIENSQLGGAKPTLYTTSAASSVTNNTQLANNSNIQKNVNHVEVRNSWFQYTPGTGGAADKVTPINEVLTDQFGEPQMFHSENLLLQSKYGVTGTNVAALSPWVHTGTATTFPDIHAMSTGTENIISQNGVAITLPGSSGVYQNLGLTISGSTTTSTVTYDAKISPAGTGRVRFALENSSTGQIYAETNWVGEGTSRTKFNHLYHHIRLQAIVGNAQAGSVRLVQQNLSGATDAFMEILEQGVTTTIGGVYAPTAGTAINDSTLYSRIESDLKVTNSFDGPVMDRGLLNNITRKGNIAVDNFGKLTWYDGTTRKVVADSATVAGISGGGTANANVGSGFRVLLPSAQTLRTLFAGTNITIDSVTNTNGLTISASGGAGVTDGDKGDITVSGSGATYTVDAAAITFAKFQNLNANRIFGRLSTSGTGTDLTGTQVTTILDPFTSSLQGVVPASGGGTTNFLRADGTWSAPAGGGSGTDNTNLGAGYRWLVPSSQGVKTLFVAGGLTADSTTNTNGITITGPATDAAPTNGSTNAVESDGVFDALALKAPLSSPTFTGNVVAPSIYGQTASGGLMSLYGTTNGTKGKVWINSAIMTQQTTNTSTSLTLTFSHTTVWCNTATGTQTLSLPTASSATNVIYWISKVSSDANTVIIDPNSTETINGASTYTITDQYQGVLIESNGTNWFVISNAQATDWIKAANGINYPTGNVGIGTATATARLHLPAGSATAGTAPLKLTGGALNTTPEAGAIEFGTTTYGTPFATTGSGGRGPVQVNIVGTTATGTLTIDPLVTNKLIFTGTTTTWTIATPATWSPGTTIWIKNRGSGNITLNTASTSNEIYSTSAVNTLSIAPGQSYMLVSDATYWNVF